MFFLDALQMSESKKNFKMLISVWFVNNPRQWTVEYESS